MITNNYVKLLKSLFIKKYRQKYNKFIVEGVKNINELLKSSIKVEKIFTTEALWSNKPVEQILISQSELKKISQLVQPNVAVALCEIPEEKPLCLSGWVLALEDVRDPGNFGTIIRLADWFGIEQIVCSHETVDLYNSKVVQATMGSFTRVQVNYVDLQEVLTQYDEPVLGTFMEGENIYLSNIPQKGILLLGNEANGISQNLEKLITQKIAIPRFGKLQQTESLNVAMATSILLSEIVSRKAYRD